MHYLHSKVVRTQRGATLVDTLVSTFLMIVVFVGITAAFRLTIDVITNNKARAGAIALANEQMEYIRSLPYGEVGTVNGIPAGDIAQMSTTTLNAIHYTRRTLVLYVDDPRDGLGEEDENDVTADSKLVKTEVSWEARQGERSISLITRVSPIGIETAVPGGTLALEVRDAGGLPVRDALVSIVNLTVNPTVNVSLFSDDEGRVTVIGAPSGTGYETTVSKPGYNSAQTYDVTAENTSPTPGHLTVAEGQTTSITFAIDILGQKTIRTFEPLEDDEWEDAFADTSNVASSEDVVVVGGYARLLGAPGSYALAGELTSSPVEPNLLAGWGELSWEDEEPSGTAAVYHVYDENGVLISDATLPGNSAGFTSSPVDLSGIEASTTPALRLGVEFASDGSVTPLLDSWMLSYLTGPTPIPDVEFAMHGSKVIGSGPGGFISKYDEDSLWTGPDGTVVLHSLEWDPAYTISVAASTGYDIGSSCGPQPESLLPGASLTTDLYLVPHTANSLLVDVRASDSSLIPGAEVRLYRGGYEEEIAADQCGHSYFGSISSGSVGGGNPYSIEVSAPGFQTFTSTEVNVSGTSRLSVVLNSL